MSCHFAFETAGSDHEAATGIVTVTTAVFDKVDNQATIPLRSVSAMSGKKNSVQALRAIAAISVVAHHSFRASTGPVTQLGGAIFPPALLIQLGAAGVDVFFIISGFLMIFISEPYFSGKKSAGQFAAQRIIRIWPPYAFATLIACVGIYLHQKSGGSNFDLKPSRLATIFFIPSFNEQGLLQPIIGPGWTLDYEIIFYMCFAFTLYLGRSYAFIKLCTIILTLFLVGHFSPPGVVHAFLGDPIIFEFLIGSAIGLALKSGRFKPSYGLAWVASATAILATLNAYGLAIEYRLLAYGLPAALAFIGFFALEDRVRWPRLIILLGDASYSIYLLHTLLIYRVIKVGFYQRHGLGELSGSTAAVVAIGVAIVGGLIFYYVVERPLLKICQSTVNRLTRARLTRPLVAQ